MADAKYLGVNDLGIPVYEIKEGSQRPLVDPAGKIKCKHCGESKIPMRVSLAPDSIVNIEWVLLCCPECFAHNVHCVMKVRLGTMGSVSRMKCEDGKADLARPFNHPDPHHEPPVKTRFVPDGQGGEVEMTTAAEVSSPDGEFVGHRTHKSAFLDPRLSQGGELEFPPLDPMDGHVLAGFDGPQTTGCAWPSCPKYGTFAVMKVAEDSFLPPPEKLYCRDHAILAHHAKEAKPG